MLAATTSSADTVEDPNVGCECEDIDRLRETLSPGVNVALSNADCLRFLTARKYDIDKASLMASEYWEWYYNTPFGSSDNARTPRNMIDLDCIEDPQREIMDELVPHSFSGFSKNGCPIFWEKTGIIAGNLGALKKNFTMEQMMETHIRVHTITDARRDYISKKLNRPVEQAMIICDYTNLSLSPDMFGIEYCKQLFQMDEKYFPERLYKTYLINAPWYFTALYALVSPWIDPKTATKIVVLGYDYIDQLREDIDDSEIPEEFGGSHETFRWAWPFDESSGASPEQLRDYITRKLGATDEDKTAI
jgi:hypothetical protein